MTTNKYIVLLLIPVFFLACGTNKHNPVSVLDVPDSVFVFKNITNSLIIKSFPSDLGSVFHLNSKKGIKFTQLDSAQMRAIAPIMGWASDTVWFPKVMYAYFIAKQEKLGDLTPIIISLNGDDYGALLYLLLDKDYKPVSYIELHGGQCGGPGPLTRDSLMPLCTIKHSFLKGNEISSYILQPLLKFNQDLPAVIDSVTYKSVIQPDGRIVTKRIDSTRYKRLFKGFDD
jgi:hypothetical protein